MSTRPDLYRETIAEALWLAHCDRIALFSDEPERSWSELKQLDDQETLEGFTNKRTDEFYRTADRVISLIEDRGMTKITVTEDDLTAAMEVFETVGTFNDLGHCVNDRPTLRAVVHALAERWSQPTLDPVVTERLGKIIEESEK